MLSGHLPGENSSAILIFGYFIYIACIDWFTKTDFNVEVFHKALLMSNYSDFVESVQVWYADEQIMV